MTSHPSDHTKSNANSVTVAIWICITCRSSLTPSAAPTMTTDGRELFDLVCLQHNTHPEAELVNLQSVECMGGCDKGCTASIGAPGKFSYLFGELKPTTEYAIAILDCALLLGQQDGPLIGRIHRPALLRDSLLGRIPPIPLANLKRD
jgi:predicted metal-binding protein